MNASLLYNTGPIFIPLLGRIFYKHRIDHIETLAIFISIVGVAFVVKPDHGLIDPKGIFGLLSGLFMAGSQTIYGVNAKREHPGSNLFYLFFLPTLFAIPALFLFPPSHEQVQGIFQHLPMILLFLGLALSSIFNQIFRGYAYQKAPAASLAPFLYFSTIIAALFDWWFFHIPPTILTIVGFLLILGASTLKLILHNRSTH
jgi:drug/metabolite transporter (DMT)-like permease